MTPGTMTSLSFLTPVVGKFEIPRAPNFNYFIRKVGFPGCTIHNFNLPNPFASGVMPADHIEYDLLQIEFKLDENLTGYFQIYDWMVGLTRPASFDQAIPIYNAQQPSANGVYSQCALTLMTNELVPNIQIIFDDVLPHHLSGFQLDTTATGAPVVTASLTMKFRQYTYNKVT